MLSAGRLRVSEPPPQTEPDPQRLTPSIGDVLASAGDDGNVILWVPSDTPVHAFGKEPSEDKESWRTKHMCRSLGTEIYDLAWSPDASYFIIGSMDNVARIYNAATGKDASSLDLCTFQALLIRFKALSCAKLLNIVITSRVWPGIH